MVETKKEKYDDDERITEPEHLRKLFIGGLDYGTTEDSLKGYFEKWGKIVDVVVMKDTKKKRSRGFGFVTYSQSYMLDDAQNARPHKIDGRVVEPKRAVPRQEIDNPNAGASIKRLFVGGLRDDHDEECLRDYFSDFGTIVDVDLITEKETGKKRGFAFVEFDDYDPVDKIVLQKSHTINNKLINVKKALSKQDIDRNNRGGQGGRGSGGGRGNDRDNWGGGRSQNDNWGGNNFGNNGGGGFGGNGGNNNWNNGPSPWDNGNIGGGGGGWNSNSGGGFGGNQGNSWGGNNDSFGNDYQQNFGGGPQRNNFSGNRPSPYGNNQGGGRGPFNKGGNQGGGFGNNFNDDGGSQGMMGGGNRRY